MLNSNTTNADNLRIYQIIDANLDRAREGLRVLEDWARFGLGKEKYVARIKNFRQILGKNHLEVYKQSRNHIEDKCKGLTHEEQLNRKTSEQIISSNSGRVQEALRVIEEFSRLHNNELSKIASEIRYEIYTIEIDLLSLSKRKKSEEILIDLESKHKKVEKKQVGAQKKEELQLSFFQLDDPVLQQIHDELMHIDINSLTPIEALMKLNEIKKLTGG